MGSGSRTVPLRWRGLGKRGGHVKLGVRGYADINHGLGYINNIGLPIIGKHIRTIISFHFIRIALSPLDSLESPLLLETLLILRELLHRC